MLKFFRSSGIGQGVMAAIVLLIIAVFVLEFRAGSGSPTSSLNEQCAVDYAGHCVDSKDYYAALALIASGTSPKDSRALSLRRRVLEGLSERELLYVEAKRLGLGVSDEAIEEELTAGRAHVSLPAEQAEQLAYSLGLCRRGEQGGCEPGAPIGVRMLRVRRTPSEPFDYALYERGIRILANRGPREFRAEQVRELVADRLRELVRSRVRVPESEVRALFERGRTRAMVRSVTLEQSWFARYAVELDDAAVERWASENSAQVDDAYKALADEFSPDCPLVSEIAVPIAPNPTEEEKTTARARIDELRERLKKGESFEQVAREASSAPSAAFGGRVGCPTSSYGAHAETVRAAAQKLEPGAVSDVVETPRALLLLRLDGKLQKDGAAAQGRRQVARDVYLKFARDEALHAFANGLISKVKAGAKLEEVVRAMTDEIARRSAPAKPGAREPETPAALLAPDRPRFELSPSFTASGNPLPDVAARESIAARAFALEKPDAIDEKPIETDTGLVVLQLKEKTEPSQEEYEREKWAILASLRQIKANEALARYVADLKRAAGEKLEIHAQFGEEPKTSDE